MEIDKDLDELVDEFEDALEAEDEVGNILDGSDDWIMH